MSKVMALARWRKDVPAPVYYAVKVPGPGSSAPRRGCASTG